MTLFRITSLLAIALGLCFSPCAQAQSLGSRTLVVYHADQPDSVAVANYYATRRNIPAANLCAIRPPSLTNLTLAEYEQIVQQPVRGCLQTVGRTQVLYIVLTYETPFTYQLATGAVYSVDSALSDLWDQIATQRDIPSPTRSHPYYTEPQTQGNRYEPFTSFAQYRARTDAKLFYAVWRLDAPSKSLAMGLIDKAIQAETAGLTGNACFDRRYGSMEGEPDASYGSGEWDLHRAAQFARAAGFAVVEDENNAEFGTAPAPLRCENAALYAGWYSLNRYYDAFSWTPGAIGFHLDSLSAQSPRRGTNWTANALLKGITITGGAVDEPYLGALVHPDGFYRDLFSGANVGDAALRNQPWVKWRTLLVGDPLYRPFPTGRAPFPRTQPEDGLALAPADVVGGRASIGTVFLAAPAPTGGALVMLENDRLDLATVPSSVRVPAGARSASFSITTVPVTQQRNVTLRALYGGITRENTLALLTRLAGLALNDINVMGGSPVEGVVLLNENAPTGGVVVTLSSSLPAAASVPARVTVPAGTNRVAFSIRTYPVAVRASVQIQATLDEVTRTEPLYVAAAALDTLTLDPNKLVGGTGTTATLRLTGPAPTGGLHISLSSTEPSVLTTPSTVTIPANSSSVTVPLTTTAVAANLAVTVRALLGSSVRSASATVLPVIASVSLSPTTVLGSRTASLSITLPLPAPQGGATITLRSSQTAVASVPATVTIPAGETVVRVPVPTSPVLSSVPVTLSVSMSGFTKTAVLTVAPPMLNSLSISASSLRGGSTTTGRCVLSGPAPAGLVLRITSSNTAVARVPASVAMLAGETAVSFTVETSAVPSSTVVSFSAALNGPTRTDTLTVLP